MKNERIFVRRCLTATCRQLFAVGERACRHCGRHRTERSWTMGIYGAFRGQELEAIDALDQVFHADGFIGRVRGQLFRLGDRTWRLTEPVIQIYADSEPHDGMVPIAEALEQGGLRIEALLHRRGTQPDHPAAWHALAQFH